MSEIDIPDEERLSAARRKITAALAEYADGWDTTESGIIVSYVAGFEVLGTDGAVRLVEACGSGDGGEQPLQVWRRDGILHWLLYGNRVAT